MNNKSFVKSIKENKAYRESVLDSLSGYGNLIYSSNIRDFLDDFIENHLEKFSKFENKYYYNNEDEIITLIIPIMRKIYGKIYVSPPSYFREKKDMLEHFQLIFDINHFCDYLIEMLDSKEKVLDKFKYLDKTIEFIDLIVDNYIACMFDKTKKSKNLKKDIRNLKLKKLL